MASMADRQQQAAQLIQRAGLQDALQHVQHAVVLMSSTTPLLREHDRAQVLKLNIGDVGLARAAMNVTAAGRATGQAALLVEQHRATPEYGQFLHQFDAVRDRVPATLEDARGRLTLGLQHADLAADDAQEILGIWNDVAGVVPTEGINGLYASLEARLKDFAKEVTPENDFGRTPHSPLTTWQWILIGRSGSVLSHRCAR